MHLSPQLIKSICFGSLAAIAMLLIAVFGNPPYAFFANLKLVVCLSALALATTLLFHNRKLSFLTIALIYLAFVEGVGKMSRSEWVPWNLSTAVILAIAVSQVWKENGRGR